VRISQLVCAIILFAGSWMSSTGIHAAAADDEDVANVREKLSIQLATFSAQGYKAKQPEVFALVGRVKSNSFPLQLQAGTTYAIVVSCDADCDHVAMSLRDGEGRLLAESPERYHTVIVNGAPSETALHSAIVSVPGCKAKECYVGLALLYLAPAGSVTIQVYRNMAFPYGGQSTSRADAFEDCQARCSQDSSCAALTFFKSSQQCRLMETAGDAFPDARADSGIKRQNSGN
jgi:hypothetical protein